MSNKRRHTLGPACHDVTKRRFLTEIGMFAGWFTILLVSGCVRDNAAPASSDDATSAHNVQGNRETGRLFPSDRELEDFERQMLRKGMAPADVEEAIGPGVRGVGESRSYAYTTHDSDRVLWITYAEQGGSLRVQSWELSDSNR